MRMLFAFVGGAGHYEPLVPLARAAVAAGHTVTFACRPSMAAVVLGDGFSASGAGPDVEERTAVGPLVVPGIEHEERVLRDGFARRTAAARARVVFDLAIEMRPDVVVCDEVDFGAMLAAEQLDLPHVDVSVLAAGSFARPELLAEPLDEVRVGLGLPADPSLGMLGRDLMLVPCPPSFRDPSFLLPASAHAIRPGVLEPHAVGAALAGPAPAGTSSAGSEVGSQIARGGRPLVYATLGTIFNMESGDLLHRIVDGLADLDVDVIATVGRQIDPSAWGPVPPGLLLERYVPQAIVLPHVDAVVSHAGSGSVIGALSFGLPCVLLPMGADQTHNAYRCRELGVGVVLDPVEATPGMIGGAVASVLADAAMGERAAGIAREVAALPDSAAAVALIEALVT